MLTEDERQEKAQRYAARFQRVRDAHQTELAEDYVELIAKLIEDTGEARVVEAATGVRPAYPDNLPRVTQRSGTVYVNGLYRHGFLLAPALAQEAAKLVLGDDARKEDVNDADRQWRDA